MSEADRYRRVATAFTERVDGVDDDGWDRPSPCEGWVARDIVVHLVEWFPAFLDSAGGPRIEVAWSPATDPAKAWASLDHQVQALLDDPASTGTTINHPQAGEHQLDAAIGMFFTGDVLLHTWDLARATGQDDALDPGMVHEMLIGMEPIADHLAASGQYGSRVAVPDDADEQTRLLAIAGRSHRWSGPPMLPDHFGADIAARYDQDAAPRFAPQVLGPTVDLLAELAGDGAALEFAVGTGRVALALADRGVSVTGIEWSAAMVAKLREKDPAERVRVVRGDMATTRVDGSFRLVYLVYNTIGNLTTQDQQVACFQNAADHLEPGGWFVIEVGVPRLRHLPPGDDAHVFSHAPGYVGYDRYTDLVAQQATSHHFLADGSGVREVMSTPFRFVWPSELDLMARLAGMTLHARWEDWQRTPFTGESDAHVSVWRKD